MLTNMLLHSYHPAYHHDVSYSPPTSSGSLTSSTLSTESTNTATTTQRVLNNPHHHHRHRTSAYSKNYEFEFETLPIPYFVGAMHGSSPLTGSETDQPGTSSPSSSSAASEVVGRLQLPPLPLKLRHCEVCGNTGATSHYGGTVCGGCKIFFSRTVQSRKGFVCERGGQCPMSAGKRAKCRACRFQLCLKAHMSPDEVGRLREMRMSDYTSTTVKREECVVGYFDESSQPSTSMADCASRIISFVDVFKYGENELAVLNIFVNLERSCENNAAYRYADMFPKKCNASIDMQNAIDFPMPICERIPMDYIRKLFLQDPKSTLKLYWCRNVLHFLEWSSANEDLGRFSRQEKVLLIAENFISVACLTSFYGFLKIQREESEKSTVDGQVPPPCSPEWFSEFTKMSPEARNFVKRIIMEILEPMDSLDVSIEELVLMKFIMIFNEPHCGPTTSDVYRIRCYRLKYCELLRKYVKAQIPDPDKRIARISELLKIVESVRASSYYLDKWLTMFYASNVCQMNDVLVYDFHVRTWNDVTILATWNNTISGSVAPSIPSSTAPSATPLLSTAIRSPYDGQQTNHVIKRENCVRF